MPALTDQKSHVPPLHHPIPDELPLPVDPDEGTPPYQLPEEPTGDDPS